MRQNVAGVISKIDIIMDEQADVLTVQTVDDVIDVFELAVQDFSYITYSEAGVPIENDYLVKEDENKQFIKAKAKEQWEAFKQQIGAAITKNARGVKNLARRARVVGPLLANIVANKDQIVENSIKGTPINKLIDNEQGIIINGGKYGRYRIFKNLKGLYTLESAPTRGRRKPIAKDLKSLKEAHREAENEIIFKAIEAGVKLIQENEEIDKAIDNWLDNNIKIENFQSSPKSKKGLDKSLPETPDAEIRNVIDKEVNGFFGQIASSFKDGFKEGFESGRKATTKNRLPTSKLYKKDPGAYWQKRGELATQHAKMEAEYGNLLSRGTTDTEQFQEALLNYANAQEQITQRAIDLNTTLEAVAEHSKEIQKGNKKAMPPSAGWPKEYGGDAVRKKLQGNLKREIKKQPVEKLGILPRGMHEIGEKLMGPAEVSPGGAGGPSAREDREYLKPGEKAPEGVQVRVGEPRGPRQVKAKWYSKREAAAKQSEKKNGGDYSKSKQSQFNLAGVNEMAPTVEDYQKAMEDEVSISKKSQAKSKSRAAKAQARMAKAKADEVEAKAAATEQKAEEHMNELLVKLDMYIDSMK